MKPHALVTNDDGIDSIFLHRLVDALLPDFQISVAAPAFEQSWIGRAVSRHGEIEVIHSPSVFPVEVDAWAISGTPTDCVNIALGNLVKTQPDIVLSGINIGYNTTEALILSSGTVAGAIEGALWGLPAIAFSKCVPHHLFESIQSTKGQTEGDFTDSLIAAAEHARRIALETLKNPPRTGTVVNINFPASTNTNSPTEETVPAKIQLGSLYAETSPGKYSFRYSDCTTLAPDPQSDRETLERGSISRSILDFARIGQRG
ncbi:MAG: 5'-nucleotidase [Lentimonas sp.]|jgi:5'-nucleotidase